MEYIEFFSFLSLRPGLYSGRKKESVNVSFYFFQVLFVYLAFEYVKNGRSKKKKQKEYKHCFFCRAELFKFF